MIPSKYANITQALARCLSIMKVFAAPSNCLTLEHERRWASTLKDDVWTSEDPNYFPFPFIHTCIVTGLFYVEGRALSNSSLRTMRWNSDIMDHYNNDGITVIDITNIPDLRYCFCFPSSPSWMLEPEPEEENDMGPEAPDRRRNMTPLSAIEYLRTYWNLKQSIELATDLEVYGVIDASTLNATWPGEWKETPRTSRAIRDESTSTAPIAETTLLFRKLVEAAFSTSVKKLPDVLRSVKHNPHFWSSLRSFVHSTPSLVAGSSTASSLLQTAFRNEHTMDLSPFDLNEKQVRRIVNGGNAYQRKMLYFLSLSGNQNLSENLLRDILSRHQNLVEFQLCSTPQIPLESKINIFRDHNLAANTYLVDTELLAEPFLTGDELGILRKPFPMNYFKTHIAQLVVLVSKAESDGLERLSCGGLTLDGFYEASGDASSKSLLGGKTPYSVIFPFLSLNGSHSQRLLGLVFYVRRITMGQSRDYIMQSDFASCSSRQSAACSFLLHSILLGFRGR